MKRILSFALLGCAIVVAPAFYLSKGKQAGKPSDGVERKYKSKPVKKPKAVTLPCGIEYTVTAKGNGPAIKKGDKVTVLYTGKLTNDTVFDASSRHGNKPLPFVIGAPGIIPGWDSVVKYLHPGDKASMKIPPQFAYGAQRRGSIPANSTLLFDIEVIDSGPAQWDAKGKDTITTPSGLKIVMFETHPDSVLAKTGKTVSVDYSGFLLDGTMFDASMLRGMPYTFVLGRDPVIKGWVEGLSMLHKGEKAKFIIPYTLAYGEGGRPPVIPPKATLVFDVHLVDVK